MLSIYVELQISIYIPIICWMWSIVMKYTNFVNNYTYRE